jgi:hypothetical protein
VLNKEKSKGTIIINVVTQEGSQLQGPKGPLWYEKEQAQNSRDESRKVCVQLTLLILFVHRLHSIFPLGLERELLLIL